MITEQNIESMYYLKEQVEDGTYDDHVMRVTFSNGTRNVLCIEPKKDANDEDSAIMRLYVEKQRNINGRWSAVQHEDIITCHYEFFKKNCGDGVYKKILRALTENAPEKR